MKERLRNTADNLGIKGIPVYLVLLSCFFLSFTPIQQSTVQKKPEVILDTNNIKIGEQVMMELRLRYKVNEGDIKVKWPHINDSITNKIE
ncbi:MAG: hypothetical protein ABEH43_03565, partial [Flavobacteriales bacterium]